jgi:hypothetical protein
MAKLVVTRKKQLQSAIVPLAVEVDGVGRGALRAGGRLEVDLPPGQHRLVVGGDQTLLVDNFGGEDRHVEIWISTFNSKGQARLKS